MRNVWVDDTEREELLEKSRWTSWGLPHNKAGVAAGRKWPGSGAEIEKGLFRI